MVHPPKPEDWIYTSDLTKDERSEKDDHPQGHGTCVASKAVGRFYGVSKSSYLVPVKLKYSSDSLLEAFILILDDVRLKNRYPAVLICSLATQKAYKNPEEPSLLPEPWNSSLGIMLHLNDRHYFVRLVVAAGNYGKRSKVVDTYPALLAEFKEPFLGTAIIAAGSTSKTGLRSSFSQQTVEERIMIWAVGEDITCAGIGNSHETVLKSGTSFAAPAVRRCLPQQ